jgi:curved DNA-binding protein CbpA
MDYYKILNVSKEASDSEIKKSYRKLAKENHPDKGGDSEKFKQIAEAYEVLSNKDKRTQYDTFGKFDGSMNINPFEIFESMFRDIGLDSSTNVFGDIDLGEFGSIHANFPQGSFNQGPLNQGSFNQGSFNQGSFNQGSFMQNMFSMPTGTNSFSQVTIIKNGKKYTKTTHNGKTVEEVSSTGKDGYLNN